MPEERDAARILNPQEPGYGKKVLRCQCPRIHVKKTKSSTRIQKRKPDNLERSLKGLERNKPLSLKPQKTPSW